MSLEAFSQGDGKLVLWRAEITEEHCDEMEARRASFGRDVELLCSTGAIRRFLRILLKDNSCCSKLTFRSRSMEGLDSVDVHDIGTCLASTHSPLRYLDIICPSCVSEEGAEEDIILARALSRNRHLQVLRLEHSFLRDTQVAKLVKALGKHPCLRELRLSGNKCGEETSAVLADLLQEPDTNLKELYLDMSGVSGRSRPKLNFTQLATALRHNKSLHTLDLTGNMIDDEDLDMLGSAMVSTHGTGAVLNTSLQTLLLGRNRITDAGLSTLLYEVLPRIRGLKTLALWGNLMEDLTPSLSNSKDNNNPKVLKNRVIKAMIDIGDVELLKAVSLPERIPSGLWPLILHRLQGILNTKAETSTNKSEDLLYLVMRGPMLSAMRR